MHAASEHAKHTLITSVNTVNTSLFCFIWFTPLFFDIIQACRFKFFIRGRLKLFYYGYYITSKQQFQAVFNIFYLFDILTYFMWWIAVFLTFGHFLQKITCDEIHKNVILSRAWGIFCHMLPLFYSEFFVKFLC